MDDPVDRQERSAVHPDDWTGPRCPICDQPCVHWRGNVHGYTCSKCIRAYLADGAARHDAREAKDRERRSKQFKSQSAQHKSSSPVGEGSRRDGGGLAPGRSTIPAVTAHRDVTRRHGNQPARSRA
nr:hypothetical protein [Mycobacterium sp. UM_NZ2]